MTPRQRIYTIIAIIGLSIISCSSDKSQATVASENTETSATQSPKTPKAIQPYGNPEKDWIFVEQAVDAWLYFHLSDFKSYKPLMRSTEYDPDSGIYTHHLRFRMINEQGGYVTLDRNYEVDLTRPGEHGNPFHVMEK